MEYIEKALEGVCYKRLDNGTWFAEIPECKGVWANTESVEMCRRELKGVLEEWLFLKIADGDPISEIEECKMKKVLGLVGMAEAIYL